MFRPELRYFSIVALERLAEPRGTYPVPWAA